MQKVPPVTELITAAQRFHSLAARYSLLSSRAEDEATCDMLALTYTRVAESLEHLAKLKAGLVCMGPESTRKSEVEWAALYVRLPPEAVVGLAGRY
jgi:hypothetical protein